MKFVTLKLDKSYGDYSYENASDIEMNILGDFFADLGHRQDSIFFFEQWPFDDSQSNKIGTNATYLEKNNNLISIENALSDEDHCCDSAIILTYEQFTQLMRNWQSKIFPHKPAEVTIFYKNNQFSIETKGCDIT